MKLSMIAGDVDALKDEIFKLAIAVDRADPARITEIVGWMRQSLDSITGEVGQA
jgi:hypothetical protein